MRVSLSTVLFIAVLAAATIAVADVVTLNTINGDWANAVGGNVLTIDNTGPVHSIDWGAAGAPPSGYDWAATSVPVNVTTGTLFSLGTFTHRNQPIPTGTAISSVDLMFTVGNFTIPVQLGATFTFVHNETPNPAPDEVTITNAFLNAPFTVGLSSYFFTLFGFSTDNGNTVATTFITAEGQNNNADLYATITTQPIGVPEPSSLILLATGLAGLAAARLRRRS